MFIKLHRVHGYQVGDRIMVETPWRRRRWQFWLPRFKRVPLTVTKVLDKFSLIADEQR